MAHVNLVVGDVPVGLDILDLVFRLERRFGIKISRKDFFKMLDKNEPPDIMVGDLFEFVRAKARHVGVIDDEMDAESIWLMFQRSLSDGLGVEPEEVAKERWLIHDLAAR